MFFSGLLFPSRVSGGSLVCDHGLVLGRRVNVRTTTRVFVLAETGLGWGEEIPGHTRHLSVNLLLLGDLRLSNERAAEGRCRAALL